MMGIGIDGFQVLKLFLVLVLVEFGSSYYSTTVGIDFDVLG